MFESMPECDYDFLNVVEASFLVVFSALSLVVAVISQSKIQALYR